MLKCAASVVDTERTTMRKPTKVPAVGSRWEVSRGAFGRLIVVVTAHTPTSYIDRFTLRVESDSMVGGYAPEQDIEVEGAWFTVRGKLWPKDGGVRQL